ncbi:MAG TPA: 50S ribosomal protein L22 [Armatimonadota bacterium]|nr:50S ribosomal protein L22 [Armatimonadota bacterium]
MEATVAKVRDFVRRKLSGERVWRVGVQLKADTAQVTIYSPDNPERFTEERDKNREALADMLQRELKRQYGRDFSVNYVQAPTAVAKYIRISPRKVRHVVDVIRGKHVQDALAILQFLPNAAAETVSKLIKSAVANAENNHRMDADMLEVMHVHVDEGPTLKRLSQRAMGRAYRIDKRTSHITVGLAESEKPSRLSGRGKSVARTVGKAPRRGTKSEGTRTKRAETTAPAAKAAESGAKKAPRRQQRKGGE